MFVQYAVLQKYQITNSQLLASLASTFVEIIEIRLWDRGSVAVERPMKESFNGRGRAPMIEVARI